MTAANPAYAPPQTRAQVVLPPSYFERSVLNRWAEGEDVLATVDDLRACVGHERQEGGT